MERLLVFVIPAAIWGTSVAIWRWIVRRLDLARTSHTELGDRERLVHRNLRRLLAFNFLVWYPTGIPGAVLCLLVGGDLAWMAATMLAGVVLMTVPLLSLSSSWMELRRQRERGMPQRDEPSIWLDGSAAVMLAASREGRFAATVGFVLLLVGGGFILFQRDSFQRVAFGFVLLALGFVVFELSRRRRR